MIVERSKTLVLALISASVFLVSLIGLMLQIALTRMFSATIWYHYTFVAVSIALFGWGLGGIVLYFFKERLQERGLDLVAVSLIIFSFFIPIYLLIFRLIPAYPTSLPAYFLLSLVPFFLAGLCMALVYSRFTGSANKLYFADLVGASVACLLAEPVLSTLGAESTILLLGIMAAAPAILLSLFFRKRKMIALSFIALAILPVISVANLSTPFLNISNAPTKEMYMQLNENPNLRVVFTRWNSFSRVDVVEGFGGRTLAEIYIDADASTEVMQWDGSISSLLYMNQSMDMLPYYFVEKPNVLIIGPGGGKDILYALAGGSSKISAVELNPTIVGVVKDYGERAGNIYNNLSNVDVYVDEGRSFVSRSNGKFDVVTLTLVDSWAAISAGGYALADNYLYTKEAFAEYLSHLTDQGELTMIRWQSEMPRLVSTAVEAFAQFGEDVQSVGEHVAIVLREIEPGRVEVLLILKKLPFTQIEAENLAERVSALGSDYSPYYIPYVKDTVEPYHSLFNGSISLEQFQQFFSYRVDAVSDDSPYYFNFEPGVPKILSDLLLFAALLSLGFVAAPVLYGHWRQRRRTKARRVWQERRLVHSIFLVTRSWIHAS
jgi:spermidine synthase